MLSSMPCWINTFRASLTRPILKTNGVDRFDSHDEGRHEVSALTCGFW
jgi:hypothetical protein